MHGFVMVPGWLLAKRPTANALLAYVHLAAFGTWNPGSGRYEECRPAIATLAEKAGLSESTMRRALRELIGLEAVTEGSERFDENGRQLPSVYRVVFGRVSPVTAPPVTDDSPEGVTGDRGRVSPVTPNQEPSTKNQNTKTSTSSRGTRLPEDWKPSEELIEWARTNAPGVGWKHHERFVDYWRGVPGAKGRKLDWDATWRNWMRRESDDLGAHPTSGAPAGQYKSAQVQNAELADLEKKRARLADHYIETEGMPTRAAYERAKRELDNAARGPVETSSPVGYIDGVIIDTDVREVTSE